MITANDVRALAGSPHVDAVLALLDGRVVVARTREASAGVVILTRTNVLEEFGHTISDLDADALAAHHVKWREPSATTSRTSAAQR